MTEQSERDETRRKMLLLETPVITKDFRLKDALAVLGVSEDKVTIC